MATNAATHYNLYPQDQLNVKPCWAYGFRPFFLVIPWYVVAITMLWGLIYAGVLPLPSLDPIIWHIYEMMYGIGFAAIAAFLLTALPEFYSNEMPIVGKKLKYIIIFWIVSRLAFWFMGIFGVGFALVTNVGFSVLIIAIAFKSTVLDSLQRHSSIAYIIVAITVVQTMFFLSFYDFFTLASPYSFLYLSISLFIALIILALKRIQMEEINEFMEELGMEEKFVVRPYRYNLTIFCILLFCICEFFFQNSILGWLCLACFASTLGIMNDYRLKYERIIFHPYVIFFATLFIMISLGYLLLGLSYFGVINELGYARHVLGMGGFAGSILVAMFIIVFVHTGRKPRCDKWIVLSFLLLLFSIVIRYFVVELGHMAYSLASVSFSAAFVVYFFRFKRYLVNKRVDGLAG